MVVGSLSPKSQKKSHEQTADSSRGSVEKLSPPLRLSIPAGALVPPPIKITRLFYIRILCRGCMRIPA
jgi:hypothetical protein